MNLTYERIFISIRQTKFVGTFVSIGYLYPTTLLKTSTLFLLNKYSESKCYNQLNCNVMTNLAVQQDQYSCYYQVCHNSCYDEAGRISILLRILWWSGFQVATMLNLNLRKLHRSHCVGRRRRGIDLVCTIGSTLDVEDVENGPPGTGEQDRSKNAPPTTMSTTILSPSLCDDDGGGL